MCLLCPLLTGKSLAAPAVPGSVTLCVRGLVPLSKSSRSNVPSSSRALKRRLVRYRCQTARRGAALLLLPESTAHGRGCREGSAESTEPGKSAKMSSLGKKWQKKTFFILI